MKRSVGTDSGLTNCLTVSAFTIPALKRLGTAFATPGVGTACWALFSYQELRGDGVTEAPNTNDALSGAAECKPALNSDNHQCLPVALRCRWPWVTLMTCRR